MKLGAVYPHKLLNKLKWTPGSCFDDVKVWYIHRGAPDDSRMVTGAQISSLGRRFFELVPATFGAERSTSIPYHRVLRIDYQGKMMFKKNRRNQKK